MSEIDAISVCAEAFRNCDAIGESSAHCVEIRSVTPAIDTRRYKRDGLPTRTAQMDTRRCVLLTKSQPILFLEVWCEALHALDAFCTFLIARDPNFSYRPAKRPLRFADFAGQFASPTVLTSGAGKATIRSLFRSNRKPVIRAFLLSQKATTRPGFLPLNHR